MRDVILHKFILDGLIDKIPYAIFWKDTQSVFLGCNQQFARQFGFNEPKEIIGKTDYDLPFQPHLQEKYRCDDAEVLKGIAKLNYEEEQTQPDGTTKTVLVSKTPLYGKSKTVVGILGIYTDITERKQREQELLDAKEKAEIASKTKTEFLENMRHDIRTPLTGIVGFAELIKSETVDPKMKEYASNLAASGCALADLLNGVLEVVKINSGEVPILKKKFSLQKKLVTIHQKYF